MAIFSPAGGIGAISGSVGGNVFSHNRFGQYMRLRSIPVNPQSQRQNKIRAAIQSLSAAWSGVLTAAQRAAWELYAANISRTNAVGGAIKLTGFNHYIRANSVRVQSDLAEVDDGPTTLTLPGADPIMVGTVDEAGQQISVAFDDTLDWVDQDDGHLLIFMSQPKAAGVKFVGGPFRLAGTIDGDSTTPPTSPTVLAAPFPVTEGQVIVVRARISEEDGRLSDLFRSQSAVAA